MEKSKKNVALLSTCQALLLVNNSILITVNALAGYALATNKAIATLPVTAYFLGSALSALPASLLMKRYGRKAGFTTGAACGMAGALLCATAIFVHSFWVLCAGTLVLGAYFASGQFYRFAAAESAAPDYKPKAISLVLAGGIVGGFVGPETSKLTRAAIDGYLYAGPYFSLIGFALITMFVVSRLDIPPLTASESAAPGRPIAVIARQPAFIIAVLCGVVGYGAMNLLMTATPLAMTACQHPFSAAAFVIQWHLIGMFAPSFFTGSLIKRFGLLRIMTTGALLMGVCVVIAISGVEVSRFWLALVVLGIGWNFLYLGATTLLTETHTTAERGKVQGVNDMSISLTMVMSSLSVGALFTYQGWQVMNLLAAPFIAIAAAGIVWLAFARRSRPAVT